MKKIISMLVCLLLFGFGAAIAQDIQIRGMVTSAEDGNPIPGVYVRIEGTNRGDATDADGNYDNKVDLSDLVLTKQEFLRTDCPACP